MRRKRPAADCPAVASEAVRARDILLDLYGRIPQRVAEAVEGLSPQELTVQPEPGSNTIGWLVWHLTRVQDSHLAEVMGTDQIWVGGEWHQRFGLTEADPSNTGYGHTAAEMAEIRPESAEALLEYHRVVADRTREYLRTLTEEDLDRIVDRRWDPPVTLGVRLVSVADDDIAHAGQAAYLRGLLDRRG